MQTEFDNGQPFTRLAGELLADLGAFVALVEARRPEITTVDGSYSLLIDTKAATILLAKIRDDHSGGLVVERVAVDPTEPETFGASVLPQPAATARAERLHEC